MAHPSELISRGFSNAARSEDIEYINSWWILKNSFGECLQKANSSFLILWAKPPILFQFFLNPNALNFQSWLDLLNGT